MKKLSPFILFFIIIMWSCNKDYTGIAPIDNSNTIPPPPPGTALSFKTFVVPIFTANCLGSACHSTNAVAPDLSADKAYGQLTGLGFVDPTDTIAEKSKLYIRMKGPNPKPMPTSGFLPQSKLDLVKRWINEGSQDN